MVADNFDEVADRNETIPALEVQEQELYHAKSFWTKWIFCQDAKVIGIQYSITAIAIGLVAMVLSWIMRLQLGFPELFFFSRTSGILSICNNARNDYGHIPLNSFVSWRIWKFSYTTNGWI